jgi:hypothetical protein
MIADADPYAVALIVIDALDAVGARCSVGGSIASSFAGEPRSTTAVDVVAALDEGQVRDFVARLGSDFYADEAALRQAIRMRSSTNLIHRPTMLKVDLFVAGGTPLDAQQLERRRLVVLEDGRQIPVHPPEDVLLQKLRWYRIGGGVSDRQWRDVLAIIRIQGSRLDRGYLQSNAPALGVLDLWQRAVEEADGP